MIFWQNCIFIRSNTHCGIDAAASLYCVFPLGLLGIVKRKCRIATIKIVERANFE